MGEDAVTYGLNVGVPLAVFVAMFLALMKSFSNRFDDLKDQVKDNGKAIAELSKDVAVIKDRLGRGAAIPSERAAYGTAQDHDIPAKTENISACAPTHQDRTAKDTDTTPSQPDSSPPTANPLNISGQGISTREA